MTKIVENAEITSTFLGREEHGILTSYITVRGDGFGVSSWEDLVGKFIRIETDDPGSRVTKIGNLIKDEWFDFEESFKKKGK